MKRRLALLAGLVALALAQAPAPPPPPAAVVPAPPPPPDVPARPLPPWIKPGLVLSYADEVGMLRAAYLVTETTQSAAYGLMVTVVSGAGGMTMAQTQVMPLVQNGIGVFYIDSEAAAAWARGPKPEGVEVTAGPGTLVSVVRTAQGEVRTAYRYDPESGVVLEFAETQRSQGAPQTQPPMPNSVHLRYLGHHQVSLPPAGPPPAVAQTAHTYRVIARTGLPGYGGVDQPMGEVSVTPAGGSPPLLLYQVTFSAPGYPAMPSQAYGTPSLGPHYLNPRLLGVPALLEAPQIGVSLRQSGPGEHGGAGFALLAGETPLLIWEYDQQSGLLLTERQPIPGLGEQVFELVR